MKEKKTRFFNDHFKSLPIRAFKLAGARRAPRELSSHHLGFVLFGSQGQFFTENKDDNQYSTNRHPADYYTELRFITAQRHTDACARTEAEHCECDANEGVTQRCNLWEKHGASILASFKGHFLHFLRDFHSRTFVTCCMYVAHPELLHPLR